MGKNTLRSNKIAPSTPIIKTMIALYRSLLKIKEIIQKYALVQNKHKRNHRGPLNRFLWAQEARPLIISRFLQQDVWNAILNMYKAL